MVNSPVCTTFTDSLYVRKMLCNLDIFLLPMFLSWSISCSYTLLGLVVILGLERMVNNYLPSFISLYGLFSVRDNYCVIVL
jgi:hypothetical protein